MNEMSVWITTLTWIIDHEMDYWEAHKNIIGQFVQGALPDFKIPNLNEIKLLNIFSRLAGKCLTSVVGLISFFITVATRSICCLETEWQVTSRPVLFTLHLHGAILASSGQVRFSPWVLGDPGNENEKFKSLVPNFNKIQMILTSFTLSDTLNMS